MNKIKSWFVVLLMCAFVMSSCISCNSFRQVKKNDVIEDDTYYAQKIARSAVYVGVEYKIDVREPMALGLIDKPFLEGSGSGSGTLVSKGQVGVVKGALVLTANHVCVEEDVEIQGFKLPVVDLMLSITDGLGNEFEAFPIIQDEDNDLCLLEVIGEVAADPAEIMLGLPEKQEHVQYAGAPAGIWINDQTAMVLDGRYAGKDKKSKFLLYTCATVGGASGSGLFYRGRLFGVVVRVNRNFHHAGFAIDNIYVFAILKAAEANGWTINFKEK